MQLKVGIVERLSQALKVAEDLAHAGKMGVAVSGGGDSMALLSLLHPWCAERCIELRIISVDHGIRPESRSECSRVGAFAAELGAAHEILTCEQIPPGNLQDAARRLRYTMIASWAARNGLANVALAHTLDDQAETFLLNLARGSGVDGLSAMPIVVRRRGIRWLRPLLKVSRAELRTHLKDRGIAWIDDPSNNDERFDRVKARRLLDSVGELGASKERLAATAERMQEAREVLEDVATGAAVKVMTVGELGDVHFSGGFWGLGKETRLRLAAGAIRRVSGSDYRPRIATLFSALKAVRSGKGFTLSGSHFVAGADLGFSVVRELAACGPSVAADAIWDRRWRLADKPAPPGSVIGPLGEEGLRECEEWRRTSQLRESLIASPALRAGEELLSAPFAGMPNGWRFRRACDHGADAPDSVPV